MLWMEYVRSQKAISIAFDMMSNENLVGVRTRAKYGVLSRHKSLTIGRTKAAVLPLPVFAHPMQSDPEN